MPLSPLPSVLREDFNDHLQQETWPEVYGAERGTLSGEPLKSGTALIFKGVGVTNPMLHQYSQITKTQVDVIHVCLYAGRHADACVPGSGLHQHSLHPVLLQIHHQRSHGTQLFMINTLFLSG